MKENLIIINFHGIREAKSIGLNAQRMAATKWRAECYLIWQYWCSHLWFNERCRRRGQLTAAAPLWPQTAPNKQAWNIQFYGREMNHFSFYIFRNFGIPSYGNRLHGGILSKASLDRDARPVPMINCLINRKYKTSMFVETTIRFIVEVCIPFAWRIQSKQRGKQRINFWCTHRMAGFPKNTHKHTQPPSERQDGKRLYI